MASTIPIQPLDDDDDFDWQAAIQEIDAACAKSTKPSSSFATATTNNNENNNSDMGSCCPKIENNKPIPSRQSTLDKFIGLSASKSDAKLDDAQDSVLCDERVSGVSIDPETAKTWIYPENVPVRDYQVSITRTALFSNTLVSLPTGLGKTLIAAVVMLNYFRWFPEGKIVFSAPSRPLVMQQIVACHNIVGIPQEKTVDMTGQTSPSTRVSLWKDKRVFFVTPQVLEKDIQSGSCAVKQLVCLVIDEAHRASGNYSYCVAVRELMAVPVQLRILALTATPGSNHQTIQQVIDNLQISSLEHRSESDTDVTPYVHDRKIDLIKVEMGKDADQVYSLLMSVIRPFVRKLSDLRVFPPRDAQTFSPYDVVILRDSFHQAPPPDVPQHRYAEVEGTFGILFTLYHMRKLISSHGIRPALEILENKLKEGCGRFLSRNEDLHKAKVLMQQNLSRGALSPKFSKMLEVLVEHFKKQDPQKSRAIIFSHFRESVSDIMSSLATIGEYVKAAEFVGQSPGKKSKGQSQKAQQAVLEKFRAGEYNVIVATSIGEEGLDIMEVDLVVCFDANISPLRMIQRMGRTGRKSEGRVVVLACEGSELNGYMKKLAISKKMKKLMLNGGTNSFLFHSSPRMVPHIYRPEKVLVKLSIEDFVHRGKKVKNDDAIHTPTYKLKLTDVETDLLAKYFDPSRENNWRPSLIAFPHFQAFPSSVHQVSHSMRTTMLIDTMQYLQGSSLYKLFNGQDEETSEECVRIGSVEHHNSPTREDILLQKEPESDILSQIDTSTTLETHDKPDACSKNPPIHSFLFGSDFTSVDSLGRVLILSVPVYPLNQVSSTKSSSPQKTLFSNCLKSHLNHLKSSNGECPKIALGDGLVTSYLRDTNDLSEDEIAGDDRVLQTKISNLEVLDTELNIMGIPSVAVDNTHSDDELSADSKAGDLSPRLTNLLMSGVVPESPINIGTSIKVKGCMSPDHDMCLVQSKNDEGDIQIPPTDLLKSSSEKCTSSSKLVGIRTPLANLSNKSCSKDWILSSGEKSVSQPKRRLKRLRKYGDIRNDDLLDKEEVVDHTSVSSRSCARLDHAYDKHGRGNKKMLNDVLFFIEDEAEVSSEASGDEDVNNEQDSYDDSFIDDRINPTVANTQAEATQIDMMAIYRRSLLTQSPIVDFSPDNMVPIHHIHDSGSASATAATKNPSLHSNGESSSVHLNSKRLSSDTAILTTTNESNEIKKRKLNFSDGESLPIRNLEKEIFLNHDAGGGKEQSWQMDEFDDDEFYQGIDFDALEEQATKQLRSKSQSLNEKPQDQNLDFLDCPSFDLGI